jgi:chromate reductase
MILILCSSEGKNVDLSEQLLIHSEQIGLTAQVIQLVDLDLPLYSASAEKKGMPPAVTKLTEQMIAAKGFVLVAPEYNGSFPPVLNNAIAWVSRSGNDDWREAFSQKFCAVATHSGGGGDKVLNAMRAQMEHLGCNVIARQILTHYQKALNPQSATAILTELKSLVQR